MFSEALKDGDFIVVVSNENKKITDMLITCMRIECKERNINWEEVKLLILEEKSANKFLLKMHRILRKIDIEKNSIKNEGNKYNKTQKQISKENMLKLKNIEMKESDRRKTDKSR